MMSTTNDKELVLVETARPVLIADYVADHIFNFAGLGDWDEITLDEAPLLSCLLGMLNLRSIKPEQLPPKM